MLLPKYISTAQMPGSLCGSLRLCTCPISFKVASSVPETSLGSVAMGLLLIQHCWRRTEVQTSSKSLLHEGEGVSLVL